MSAISVPISRPRRFERPDWMRLPAWFMGQPLSYGGQPMSYGGQPMSGDSGCTKCCGGGTSCPCASCSGETPAFADVVVTGWSVAGGPYNYAAGDYPVIGGVTYKSYSFAGALNGTYTTLINDPVIGSSEPIFSSAAGSMCCTWGTFIDPSPVLQTLWTNTGGTGTSYIPPGQRIALYYLLGGSGPPVPWRTEWIILTGVPGTGDSNDVFYNEGTYSDATIDCTLPRTIAGIPIDLNASGGSAAFSFHD